MLSSLSLCLHVLLSSAAHLSTHPALAALCAVSRAAWHAQLDAAAAESAIQELDQSEVAGRPIHVKVAGEGLARAAALLGQRRQRHVSTKKKIVPWVGVEDSGGYTTAKARQLLSKLLLSC